MGRSITRFIACCFFAAHSLFVLSPFFIVLFPSFFCFCYFLAAKRCFSEKMRFFLAPFFRPPCFFFWKRPLFSFCYRRRFFFLPLFPSFLFFLALLSIYKYYVGYLFLFFLRVRKNRRVFGPGFFFQALTFRFLQKFGAFLQIIF